MAPGSVTQTGNRHLFAFQPTLTLTPNYTLSYVGATFGIMQRPATPTPAQLSTPHHLWNVAAQQSAWFGSVVGEPLDAGTSYVDTLPGEGFPRGSSLPLRCTITAYRIFTHCLGFERIGCISAGWSPSLTLPPCSSRVRRSRPDVADPAASLRRCAAPA